MPRSNSHDKISKASDNQDTPSGRNVRRKSKVKKNSVVADVPKITDVKGGNADKIAGRANEISLASVIVNGLLLICTLGLAYISYEQANSADSAAKIADKTLQADTAYNNKVYAQSRKDAKANDQREDKRDARAIYNTKIQNDALKAQIASLRETQKEFEIETRPFLQVTDIKLDTPKDDMHGSFQIMNSGKQPGMVLISDIKVTLSDSANYERHLVQVPVNLNGVYISNTAGYHMNFGFREVEDWQISRLKTRVGFLFMKGLITYKSLSSKRIYKSAFFYKIHLYPQFGIEINKEIYH